MRDLARTAAWVMPALTGLYVVRTVMLTDGLPPGDDIPYHLAKNRFAVEEFFRRGVLDGWSPLFSQGSQQFLLYGPGMAIAAALVRGVTFGLVSDLTALKVVMVLSFAAIAPASMFLARALGLSRLAAAAIGFLSLTVSVPYGVGVSGTFDLGLAPHQLAAPFVLVAWGALVRLLRSDGRRWALVMGIASAVVVVTHLTSFFGLAIGATVIVAVNALVHRAHFDQLWRLGVAAVWALTLSAFWWVPLARDPGPRPATATWSTPSFTERLRLILSGTDSYPRPVAWLVIAALTALCVVVISGVGGRRDWRPVEVSGGADGVVTTWIALAIGPTVLAVTYALHYRLSGDVGALVANRNLGYALCGALLPIGWWIDRLSRRDVAPAAAVARLLVGLLVFVTAVLMVTPSVQSYAALRDDHTPTASLAAVADVIAAEVAPPARMAWAHEANFDHSFGLVHPELWLTEETGVATMNGFGGETVTPLNTFRQYDLAAINPAEGIEIMRNAGVTHLVSTPMVATLYQTAGWRITYEGDDIAVTADPLGSAQARYVDGAGGANGPMIRLLSAEPERLAWSVSEPGRVRLALPAFRKWTLRVDSPDGDVIEMPVGTDDGYLTADVPGPGTLSATFRRGAADAAGVGITASALVWLCVGPALALSLRRLRARVQHVEGSQLDLLDDPPDVFTDDTQKEQLQPAEGHDDQQHGGLAAEER